MENEDTLARELSRSRGVRERLLRLFRRGDRDRDFERRPRDLDRDLEPMNTFLILLSPNRADPLLCPNGRRPERSFLNPLKNLAL